MILAMNGHNFCEEPGVHLPASISSSFLLAAQRLLSSPGHLTGRLGPALTQVY